MMNAIRTSHRVRICAASTLNTDFMTIPSSAAPILLSSQTATCYPASVLIDLTRLPKHVAIIMDGNGRWAMEQGELRMFGHKEGTTSVTSTVRAARRLGVEALTLFAFSEQNWNRPEPEVTALMQLLHDYLISEREEMIQNQIRVRAIGRRNKLPTFVREVLVALERDTSHLTGMTLTLALSYGGREELIDTAAMLAREGVPLTMGSIEARLPSMACGPVDLLIRTGGEQRISNFVLWASAYAEFVFTSELWPNFDEQALFGAIKEFQLRDRRFGRASSGDVSDVDPLY